MGIIGDIIDDYYEHKHRESVSNRAPANKTRKSPVKE